MTPTQVTPEADLKRVRAAKLKAHFYETGNSVESFVAEGGAVAELEPLSNLRRDRLVRQARAELREPARIAVVHPTRS